MLNEYTRMLQYSCVAYLLEHHMKYLGFNISNMSGTVRFIGY
jgi:hypothetical protein